MKKFAIASLFVLAAASASAQEASTPALGLDFGVEVSRDNDRNSYGLTVGNRYDAVTVTAGLATTYDQADDQRRLSLVAGYDVVELGPVTVTAKAGAAYLVNEVASNGWAGTVGLGLSVPVTGNVSATLDLARQYGQDRVSQFDGDRVAFGIKVGF